VVDVTDPHGARWGERRLVRALRTWVPQAGDGAAEQLVSAAAAHAGDTPLDDDLVVLAARRRP
jgi:serine phosphatase RsbU (regulator of sigma subunit)